MSSLRIESPRLCWIEAFKAVADEENISEAANLLGLTQPTVSRYLQALERWLGKDLIKVGGIRDPENPRVSIALTEDGRMFYPIAEHTVASLENFRTMAARSEELRSSMATIVEKMQADLNSATPSRTSERWREVIHGFANLLEALNDDIALEHLVAVNQRMRSDFARYETEKKREAKIKPRQGEGKIDIGNLKL